jgi:metal-dependent amidase/aminoacylase/carboxypeptidase family protein
MEFKQIIRLFPILFIISCNSNKQNVTQQKIERYSNEIFENLINIRRDLHRHPELSGKEKRTSRIVEEYLLGLGLEVKKHIGGYGVVGILNGDKKGKKIAWRADMDAFKHNDSDKTDFTSLNDGIAHICGHDVHTAIGLGIANVLSKYKEDIDGTVYFIFQPAEETFKGAKAMIDDGLFDVINPDEIYGLHIFPTETGTVSTKSKELFAYEKKIKVSFGKGIDPDKFRVFFKNIMQNFVRNKPKSTPWSIDYLANPNLGLENPNTIYEDYFILDSNFDTIENEQTISFESTFFETDSDRLDTISNQVTSLILNSEYRNTYLSTSYSKGNPTVLNDPELTKTSLRTLDSLYGAKYIKPIYGQVPYSNEDFIYFQYRIPGVMFFLGGSNKEKGLIAMPHTKEFIVDEDAIKYGVEYFSTFLADRVNK